MITTDNAGGREDANTLNEFSARHDHNLVTYIGTIDWLKFEDIKLYIETQKHLERLNGEIEETEDEASSFVSSTNEAKDDGEDLHDEMSASEDDDYEDSKPIAPSVPPKDEDNLEVGSYYKETNVYYMGKWFYYHTTEGRPGEEKDAEATFPYDYAKCTEEELEIILDNFNHRFFPLDEDEPIRVKNKAQISMVLDKARWAVKNI